MGADVKKMAGARLPGVDPPLRALTVMGLRKAVRRAGDLPEGAGLHKLPDFHEAREPTAVIGHE